MGRKKGSKNKKSESEIFTADVNIPKFDSSQQPEEKMRKIESLNKQDIIEKIDGIIASFERSFSRRQYNDWKLSLDSAVEDYIDFRGQ